MSNKQREELLNANYWENFKFEMELAKFLPIDHPKRMKLRESSNDILRNLKQERNEQQPAE